MRPPTPGEDGRRIVRHGMADVLAWLGEPVGPRPGEPVLSLRDHWDGLAASMSAVGVAFRNIGAVFRADQAFIEAELDASRSAASGPDPPTRPEFPPTPIRD